MIVGAILFFGARIVSKSNDRTIKNDPKGTEDKDFLMLVNNAMFAVRAIGAIMVLAGGIIIIFVK
jgi:hypothetical protein